MILKVSLFTQDSNSGTAHVLMQTFQSHYGFDFVFSDRSWDDLNSFQSKIEFFSIMHTLVFFRLCCIS